MAGLCSILYAYIYIHTHTHCIDICIYTYTHTLYRYVYIYIVYTSYIVYLWYTTRKMARYTNYICYVILFVFVSRIYGGLQNLIFWLGLQEQTRWKLRRSDLKMKKELLRKTTGEVYIVWLPYLFLIETFELFPWWLENRGLAGP